MRHPDEYVQWAEFKIFVDTKDLSIQILTEDAEVIVMKAYDGPTFRLCAIHKTSQSAEFAAFEADYRDNCNRLLSPTTPDNRTIGTINRIPLGFTIFPTGRGDDITAGAYGTGPKLKLDSNNLNAYVQFLGHWYGIGGRIIWEAASIEDEMSAMLVAPASTGQTLATGDYTKYNVGGPYNMVIPVAVGTGDWSIDLAAKLTNTQILKMTPVPQAGNTGWFDYDSDANVLTRNMTQTGGYNLYDFDINLFRFANTIFGRKQDGAETILEASDVVGKLLYNSWKIKFTLTPATGNTTIKCGIMVTTAVKKNV